MFKSEVKPASENLKKAKEIWEALQKNSTEYLEIDAYELQDILNTEFMKGKYAYKPQDTPNTMFMTGRPYTRGLVLTCFYASLI